MDAAILVFVLSLGFCFIAWCQLKINKTIDRRIELLNKRMDIHWERMDLIDKEYRPDDADWWKE